MRTYCQQHKPYHSIFRMNPFYVVYIQNLILFDPKIH